MAANNGSASAVICEPISDTLSAAHSLVKSLVRAALVAVCLPLSEFSSANHSAQAG